MPAEDPRLVPPLVPDTVPPEVAVEQPSRSNSCLFDPRVGRGRLVAQILERPFSAVSKPIFATKGSFLQFVSRSTRLAVVSHYFTEVW